MGNSFFKYLFTLLICILISLPLLSQNPKSFLDNVVSPSLNSDSVANNYEANEFVPILKNKGYQNIFTDIMKLSVASNGRFGYDDLNARMGDGFVINPISDLFGDCGIISGCSKGKLYSSVRQDSDFKTILSPYAVNSEIADNHIRTIFDDSKDVASIGLQYIQDVYSWNGEENKNFIIVDYAIVNTSYYNIDNFYFGIFTDWDLVEPANNSCHYNTVNNFMYSKSNDEQTLFSGIKILSDQAVINYSFANIGGGDGYINLRDGFSDVEKYAMISNSSVISPDIICDIVVYTGVGPISIEANDTAFISLAFIVSEDASGMDKALEISNKKYCILHPEKLNKHNKPDFEDVSIFPNPTTEYIMLLSNLPCSPNVDIYIYDELGSVVYQELDFNGKKINLKHLSQGIYFITIGCDGVLERKKILKLD